MKSANNELGATDRKILRALQEDGRMTVQTLAERVGLSASPCLRRVRRMEEAGIITSYSATVDQKAVGLPVSVFISIKLERQRETQLDRFAAAVRDWPEVMECYLMTGQFDFLLRVVCADLGAMRASCATSSRSSTASARSSRASHWPRSSTRASCRSSATATEWSARAGEPVADLVQLLERLVADLDAPGLARPSIAP